MVREVSLTRGCVAMVDDEDYDPIAKYNWSTYACKWTCYAIATIAGQNVRMHNFITGRKGVDHIDGNGLNNTRANLRFATESQNRMNTRLRSNKQTSKYKGVDWWKPRQTWRARINVNGRAIHVGYFPTEEEAALARDRAAIEYHGEFATLNFGAGTRQTRPSITHAPVRVQAPRRGSQRPYCTKNHTKYKGVFWRQEAQKWRAKITANGVTRWLGHFDTEEEAARAYDRAALAAFGPGCYLNCPDAA